MPVLTMIERYVRYRADTPFVPSPVIHGDLPFSTRGQMIWRYSSAQRDELTEDYINVDGEPDLNIMCYAPFNYEGYLNNPRYLLFDFDLRETQPRLVVQRLVSLAASMMVPVTSDAAPTMTATLEDLTGCTWQSVAYTASHDVHHLAQANTFSNGWEIQ